MFAISLDWISFPFFFYNTVFLPIRDRDNSVRPRENAGKFSKRVLTGMCFVLSEYSVVEGEPSRASHVKLIVN